MGSLYSENGILLLTRRDDLHRGVRFRHPKLPALELYPGANNIRPRPGWETVRRQRRGFPHSFQFQDRLVQTGGDWRCGGARRQPMLKLNAGEQLAF
jgi:hypothetical protein